MESLRNAFRAYLKNDREKKRQYFHTAYQEIGELNLKFLQLASVSTVFLLLLFFLLTPFIITDWDMTPQHSLFLPVSFLFAVISICYGKSKRNNYKTIFILCLLYEITLLIFIILIDIFTDPGRPGSFFGPLAVALPALFILPLKLSYLLLFVFEALYITLAFSYKVHFIAQYDVFASVVGITFSLVIAQTILHLRSNDFDLRLRYQQLSQQDFLSGILNKQAFEEAAHSFLQNRTPAQHCALLLFDLDDFKNINDTLGHYAGDQLLRKIGDFLPQLFRVSDLIGRFGGDEFVILIKGSITVHTLERKCSMIQQRLHSLKLTGLDTDVTCSIGGVISHDPQITYEELFIQADKALYTAKGNGKNRWHLTG